MNRDGDGAKAQLLRIYDRRRRHSPREAERLTELAWSQISASAAALLPPEHSLDRAHRVDDLGGDAHAGAFPVGVSWVDGSRWIHKPRSSWQEQLVGTVLHEVGDRVGLPWPEPDIRSDGCQSWIRPAVHSPVVDEAELREFFVASGVLLAVGHVLRLGDLNHENVIAAGPRPVLVDAEFICRPAATLLQSPRARTARKAFEASVLGTLMLPLVSDPAEPSALGVAGGSKAPDGSTNASRHLPILDGRRGEAQGFVDEVVEGYRAALDVLITMADQLGEQLHARRDQQVRVLVKPTIAYAPALRWLAARGDDEPAAERRRELMRRLRVDLDSGGLYPRQAEQYDDDRLRGQVCLAEADALIAGDVPCFSVPLDGRSLHDRSGTRADEFVVRSPLEDWARHVAAFDAGTREHSVELIRSSLALH